MRFPTILHASAAQIQMVKCSVVLSQFVFPFDFDTIFNFFYRSHVTILSRLSDGNRKSTDFEKSFRFDIRIHTIYVFVESPLKGKIEW